MGHYCWCCCSERPNEAFSGKGHRRHLCKSCARRPKDELAACQAERDIFGYMRQRHISETNIARLTTLAGSNLHGIAPLASLVLDVARIKPHKRRRIRFLAQNHRELLLRLAKVGLVDEFEVFEQVDDWDEPEEVDESDDLPDLPWEDPPDEEVGLPYVNFDDLEEPEIPF